MNLYHSLNSNWGIYFDVPSACVGVLSALLWFASARVSFTFGFDNDAELQNEMSKASSLNAFAALSAGIAAIVVAAKIVLVAP
jgi:hypothetical protein